MRGHEYLLETAHISSSDWDFKIKSKINYIKQSFKLVIHNSFWNVFSIKLKQLK